MKAIEVKNLIKHYGKTKAVDDISFSVEEGEIFGYLGQNGAGKTTTISCLMDFLRPDSGHIQILNKDAQKEAVELKRQIGYLSDTLALYDKWNGKQHFAYINHLNDSTHTKEKISSTKDLIKRLDFDPHTKAGKLSTGNRQKLGLILALMHRPKLLILDEPTNGLDPIMQNTFYELLKEFRAEGSTVFMSSHNLTEIEKVSDRVGIIRAGKMVTTENIETLKQKRLYSINVAFADPIQKEELKAAGIEVREETPTGFSLHVSGDIEPALKTLSNYKIKNLEIKRASLESIFLEYYAK